MSASDAVRIVVAWHEALNDGRGDELIALSIDDIEVEGPRGSGRGADLLREWVARANIQLKVGRIYHRNDVVVVEEHAEWRAADTGEVIGRDDVASVFRVRDGCVAYVGRYPNLASALQAGGLSDADE